MQSVTTVKEAVDLFENMLKQVQMSGESHDVAKQALVVLRKFEAETSAAVSAAKSAEPAQPKA